MHLHIDERTGRPARTITTYIWEKLTPDEQALYSKAPYSEQWGYNPPMDATLERPPVLFEPSPEERERAAGVNAMTAPAPALLYRQLRSRPIPIVPRRPRSTYPSSMPFDSTVRS